MSEQLKSKTTVQLRLMARDLEIQGRSSMRKSQLVDAIATHLAKMPNSQQPVPSSLEHDAEDSVAMADVGSSSSLQHVPEAGAAQPAETLAASDPGLPLPQTYQQSRLQLMVQDPHHLYAYWEVDPAQVERLQEHVGGHLVLLIFAGEDKQELRRVDVTNGGYYLAVSGGEVYSAELALQDDSGRLVSLLRSNQITMPVDQPVIGDGDAWMSVQARHERLTLGPDGKPLRGGLATGDAASSLQWARLERVWRHQKTGPTSDVGSSLTGLGGASSPGSQGLNPLFGRGDSLDDGSND